MIQCTAQQGSDEWLADRAGCTTASVAADALSIVGGLTEQQATYVAALKAGKTEAQAMAEANYKAKPKASGIELALQGLPVGEPSDAALGLAARLAIERIAGKPYGNSGGGFYATERGHEQEAYARMRYEARFGVIVDEIGLCKTDDGLFGASFDGTVGDDGAIEVKTPLNPLKAIRIIQTGDVSEYMTQVLAGFFVRGHRWTDILIAIPDLAHLNNGNELWIKRVHRDEKAIEEVVAGLWLHEARVRKFEALLREPYGAAANDVIKLAEAA
ncbi:MAG TPA: YqaJ viral recombinase family protein [Rubrivivax sp.]|nr:YqaJ viral recombinase family protein [Rubrivivax sp.]HRY86506.1 YqaJ viral recombinase family protein [Rubrivivax sp.]